MGIADRSSPLTPANPNPSPSSSSMSKPVRVGAGLRNTGNTCYVNSVLQCIIHNVPMLKKLITRDHDCPCSRCESGFCLLFSLRKLVYRCLLNSGSHISPKCITDNLKEISPEFQLGIQEDAHEFLLCLLEVLDNCYAKSSFKQQLSCIDKYTPVKEVYGGRTISQLRCCECGHVSNTLEPLIDLSLEIEDVNTLEDALASFTKVEKIEEYSCGGCKARVTMDKYIKFDQAPEVVSLHLKRFRYGSSFEKIDNYVQYPKELDLKPFLECTKEEQVRYDLFAVLVHSGEHAYCGHYYCYVRSSPDTWHEMNDSMVTEVSEAVVLEQSAYILFYQKQGSSPCFATFMEDMKEIIDSQRKHSPQSVLDLEGIFPSSPEETSSPRKTPENNEEPGPCPDSLHDSVSNREERDHSPCTPYAPGRISHVNGASKAVTSQSPLLTTTRPRIKLNIDDIFQDEALDHLTEDEKENLMSGATDGPKRNTAEKIAHKGKKGGYCDESVRRLMRSMPRSRRTRFQSLFDSEERAPKRQNASSNSH